MPGVQRPRPGPCVGSGRRAGSARLCAYGGARASRRPPGASQRGPATAASGRASLLWPWVQGGYGSRLELTILRDPRLPGLCRLRALLAELNGHLGYPRPGLSLRVSRLGRDPGSSPSRSPRGEGSCSPSSNVSPRVTSTYSQVRLPSWLFFFFHLLRVYCRPSSQPSAPRPPTLVRLFRFRSQENDLGL